MTKHFTIEIPVGAYFKFTSRLRKLHLSGDTLCQRLNLYISGILVLLAFLVSILDLMVAKNNKGISVFCYCPAQFTSSQVDYTNYMCYMDGLYFIPYRDRLPVTSDEGRKKRLHYYPWVPMILAVQALLFSLPRFLWRAGSHKLGFSHKLDINLLEKYTYRENSDDMERCKIQTDGINADRDTQKQNDKKSGSKIKKDEVITLAECLARLIKMTNTTESRICCVDSLVPRGYHYTVLFVVTDLLYIINAIFQFYLIEYLLGIDFLTFGLDAMFFFSYFSWEDQSRFPRSALCDLTLRQQNNIQPYTIQCSLPLNMLNEKIFLLIWISLICLAIVNTMSFAYHVIVLARVKSVFTDKIYRHQLKKCFDSKKIKSKYIVSKFVNDYLKMDIVLYLWTIGRTHKPAVSDLIDRLWNKYKLDMDQKRESENY